MTWTKLFLQDAATRLQKARVKSLQDQIKELNKDLQAKEKLAKDSESEVTRLKAENAELQKKNKALTQQVCGILHLFLVNNDNNNNNRMRLG